MEVNDASVRYSQRLTTNYILCLTCEEWCEDGDEDEDKVKSDKDEMHRFGVALE